MRLPSGRALAFAIAALAVLIGLGLAIAQDQETLRIKTSVAAEDPVFPDYLASLLGRRLTTGDAYLVHTNGDHAFPAMLAAIDHAQRRVALESYIFETDDVGTRFSDALAAAARRGVAVRLVLDAVGSKGMRASGGERLRAAGVRIGWASPLTGYSLEEVNYRTHRKILVVDGRVAFVGGMGIAGQWAHDTDAFPRWRDTQVELHGPVVSNVEAGFNQNWMATGGVVDPQLRPTPEPRAGSGQSIVVWSSPQGGANEMKLLYLLAIASARRGIDIQSPYLITDESSQWSLRQARQRGVQVRLLVEGDRTDAHSVKYASRADYDVLLAQGIHIAEYQPTMMHAKAMVVDGFLSIVGSANFDNRSLELNDELNVAVFDRELARRLTADFERDLRQSKPLSLDAWRARPFYAKSREWLWSYFGEVF